MDVSKAHKISSELREHEKQQQRALTNALLTCMMIAFLVSMAICVVSAFLISLGWLLSAGEMPSYILRLDAAWRIFIISSIAFCVAMMARTNH